MCYREFITMSDEDLLKNIAKTKEDIKLAKRDGDDGLRATLENILDQLFEELDYRKGKI